MFSKTKIYIYFFFKDPHDLEEDEEDFEQVDDYYTILEYLAQQWILTEIDHQVSKVAANAFWLLAKTWFKKLFHAKEMQKIKRKTPCFEHLRRRIHTANVPPIQMDIAYEHKATGEVSIVNEFITPKSRFPPNEFEKIWEVAHVKVMLVLIHVLFVYFEVPIYKKNFVSKSCYADLFHLGHLT